MTAWENDLLSRQIDAQVLTTYLTSGRAKDRAFVLNVDAAWGQGKSYFLKNWAEDLLAKGFSVARVDAWADDYADDPLLAVVSAIDKAFPKSKDSVTKGLAKTGAKFVGLMAKHGAKAVVTKVLGEDGKALYEVAGENFAKEGASAAIEAAEKLSEGMGERLLKRFEDGQKTIAAFRTQLQKAVAKAGHGGPLIVLVDELDRCRPTYAVEMLERIKHLFDVPNLVFVVATDTAQLCHAVGAIYGNQFDGRGYLLRFFDRTYRFAEPNRLEFIRYMFDRLKIDIRKLSSPQKNDHVAFFGMVASRMDLRLREIERTADILATATELWDHPCLIETLYMLPLIVAEVRNDNRAKTALSNGKIQKEMRALMGSEGVDFKFPYWSEGTQKAREMTWPTLLEEFLATGQETLPEILRYPNQFSSNEWIIDRFREELSLVHKNQHQNQPPRSLIWTYPQHLSLVARFVAEKQPA
jgi:KAP family P-loop domain